MPPRARRKTRKAHASRGVEAFALTLPNGRSGLYVGDRMWDDDPPAVKEGLSRRRVLAATGRCPCGAESPFDPALISPAVVTSAVTHRDDCPAADANLGPALRRADR